ncbi:MAG: GWxTD domain-containing protein [Acidobacteriota bacterium]
MHSRLAACLCLLLLGSSGASSELRAQDRGALRDEESQDYYRKWLDQDVTYIITDEERAVFNALTTSEEKEQFIEQFWFRRDPDPSTAINEFKEEHYRRIAYANDHFGSGLPGWMTDRGRIYIIHGAPVEIEAHPSGGYYERPAHEGGGSTVTYPFEVWRYRHIDDVGDDIELEFVDPSLTGEYKLALYPEEKDALLNVPGGGSTLAEELGLATKADRPWFSPGNRDRYPLMPQRARDNPFSRYETYAMVQRPAQIKHRDLKEVVQVNLNYAALPVDVDEDYFKLSERDVLVPITLRLENRNLTFQPEGDRRVARIAVYGIVTSIAGRVVSEFENDLEVAYSNAAWREGLLKTSVYQKVVSLERRLRYKLVLVVKDLNSQKIGVVRQAVIPPAFEAQGLGCSSLVLADRLQVLEELPEAEEMFVIGDVKVRPSADRRFEAEDTLGLYFHLYNVSLDQSSLRPDLELVYDLLRDGRVIRQVSGDEDRSIEYFSQDRVVVVRQLPLQGLEAGHYQLHIRATDRLTGRTADLAAPFDITPPSR